MTVTMLSNQSNSLTFEGIVIYRRHFNSRYFNS